MSTRVFNSVDSKAGIALRCEPETLVLMMSKQGVMTETTLDATNARAMVQFMLGWLASPHVL